MTYFVTSLVLNAKFLSNSCPEPNSAPSPCSGSVMQFYRGTFTYKIGPAIKPGEGNGRDFSLILFIFHFVGNREGARQGKLHGKGTEDGRKVRLIDLFPLPIRSSDCIGPFKISFFVSGDVSARLKFLFFNQSSRSWGML